VLKSVAVFVHNKFITLHITGIHFWTTNSQNFLNTPHTKKLGNPLQNYEASAALRDWLCLQIGLSTASRQTATIG